MKLKLVIVIFLLLTLLSLQATVRNVAPVLDTSYDVVLVSIQEGDLDSMGNTVQQIVDPASITDGDGGVVSAIAVTEVDNTNGSWQYSLNDGASWHDFSATTGSVVDISTQARLLDGSLSGGQTNKIRFVPLPDYPDTLAWTPPDIPYDGASYFKFRAWDRVAGITGLTADVSLNGGSTSFSSNEDVARITILAVNDDPVLYYNGQEVTGVMDLGFDIDEDTSYHFQSGELIVDDPDIGNNQIIFDIEARKGILDFVNVSGRFISGNGTSNVTIVTDLVELNQILDDCSYYYPNQDLNHTEVLTIRINDQFWSGIGGGQDVVRQLTFWINPVNDAPVLNTGYTPRLTSIPEDDLDNDGNSISSIIPNGSIYDVDTTAVEAMAVISVDNTNGTWEYSTNNGDNWQSISQQIGVNDQFETNALLLDGELTGDQTHRMRFLPNLNFHGTASFAFRAWDKTDGLSASRINATVNGDTMSISAASDNGLISVTSINDVPAVYYKNEHEADTLQVFIPITSPMNHTFAPEDSLDIFDPDIGNNVMMVNIITERGTMTFHGARSRYVSNNGTGNVTLTGNLDTINAHLDNVTYTVPAGETGYDFVDFVMSDFGYSGSGASQTIHNIMLVQLSNVPPVYESIPITSAYEDSLYEYIITTSDADTNRVYIDSSVLPEWLTITDNGDNTATLSGIPTNDHVGANPVTIDIWDWVTPDTPVLQQFVINVINTNDAPRFTSNPILQVDEGSLYQYNVTAEDVDGGSNLALDATVHPDWLTFTDNGDGTGLLTGTPLNVHVGFHPVTLTLTDGIISSNVTQSFNVEVIDVNSPPFVTVPIPDQNTVEDFTPNIVIDLRNHFDDIDPNTTLVYSATSNFAEIRANVVGTDLILSPAPDFFGSTDVEVTADDQHASGGIRPSNQTRDWITDTFTVNLAPVNDAPRFVSTPVTVATENVAYTYNAQAIEVDPGDPIILGATTLPGWSSFTDNGNGLGVLSGTPAPADLGFHAVTLTAIDNIIPTPAEQSFDIYVNSIPVFITQPVTLVDEDAVYTYNIGTTDNNPDAVLTISANNLPTWLTLTDNGDGTALLTGTPTNDFVGDNSITIELSDGYVTTPVEQTFDITVNNMNDAPFFTSTPVLISNVNQLYVYNVTVDDIDANQTLNLTSSALPGWLSFTDNNDGTGILTGTPQLGDDGIENISLFVDDGEVLSPVEQSFVLEVREPNEAPYFSSNPIDSALQDQPYAYNIVVEDNNAWASISITGLLIPNWCTITDNGDGTAVLSGTPGAIDLGAHDVILEATDGIIATPIQQVFTITVYDQNTPPVFTSVPITDGIEDQLYQYTLTANDANFWAVLSFAAPTLPSWLVLTDNGDGTALLEGTPLNEHVGNNPVIIEVTDGVSQPVQQSFTIDVTNTNDAPVFTSVPVTTATEGFVYTYNITVNDVDDGAVITIMDVVKPLWLTFTDNGDGTAVLTGTPDGTALGSDNVILSATDGIIATPVEQNFNITVDAFNYPPLFTSNPITSATEDILYSYNITASDPNTWAVLDINATVLPAWLTFIDNNDGTASLSGTPDDPDVGQHNVTLTLTDNQIANPIEQNFIITVNQVNDTPAFSVFPTDITINELELYQFDVVATDPDNPNLSLSAISIPTWLSFVDNGDNTGHLEGTPDGNEIGNHTVTLRVDDGVGGVFDRSFTITVNQFNYSPTFTSSPVVTVLQDNNYIYNVVTEDPNTWATIVITSPILPAWLTFTDNGDGTATLTGTPGNAEVGFHNVTLRVDDTVSVPIDQVFTIEVINVNDGPVVSVPLPDQNVQEDFTNAIIINLDQHFTDIDGNNLIYSIVHVASEIDAEIVGNTLTLNSVLNWNGTTTIQVTADDQQTRASVSDTFDVIIAPVNDALVFTTTNDTLAIVGNNYVYTAVVQDPDVTDVISFNPIGLPAWLNFTDNTDRTATIDGNPQSSDYGVYDFVLEATDGTSTTQQNIHIRVHEDNVSPVFTSTPVLTVNQDDLYQYNITTTDANAWANLDIYAQTMPLWLTLTDNDDGTAVLSGTPTNSEVGSHQLEIAVSDGVATPVVQSFTVIVNNVNDGPTVSTPLPDLVEVEDFETPIVIDLNQHFNDIDGNTLLYSDTSVATEIGVSINANLMTITSVADWNGTTTILVTADDQQSRASVSDAFDLVINPVNDIPVVTSVNDTLATVGTNYTYTIVVQDPDTPDTITFTPVNLPSWLSIVDNLDRTATLSGTPQSSEYGVYDFSINVSDATETVQHDIYIRVHEDNYAPVFTSTEVTSVNEDTQYSYNITTSDANAWATLTINGQLVPTWLTFTDNGDGTASLVGTPTNNEVGQHNVELTVSDGIAAAVQQFFVIDVINVNDDPQLVTAISDMVEDEDFADISFDLAPHFNDPDSDALIYNASVQSGQVNTVVNGSTLSIESISDWFGTATINVTADDQISPNLATDTFDIVVNPINDLPFFVTLVDTLANVGDLYSYTATVQDNDTADNIAFSIIGTVPAWLTFTDNTDRTASFEGTPASIDYGVYDFTLEATDGTEVIYQDIHIRVHEDNYLPVFLSTPVTDATEDVEYTYNVEVTDQNAWNTITLDATAPAWLTFTDNGMGMGTLTGTPDNSHVGTWAVTLTAYDGIIEVLVLQEFQITVENVNDAPYAYAIFDPVNEVEDYATPLTYDLNNYIRDDDAGDVITFSAAMSNTPAIIQPSVEGSILTLTAVNNACGVDTLIISATDDDAATGKGRDTISIEVIVTIDAVNDEPFVSLEIEDFEMDENTIDSHINLTNHFDDADIIYGGSLQFDPSDPDNMSVSLSGTTLVIEPLMDWYGTESITVTAIDEFNEEVSDTFDVTVLNVSDVPVIQPIDNQFILNSQTDTFEYQVEFYAYPDIAFTLEGAPQGMQVDAQGMISWTPNFAQYGLHTITVNGQNVAGQDSKTFELRVINEIYGPTELRVNTFTTDTINLQWAVPPTDAWITGYRVYTSDSYDGIYSELVDVTMEETSYEYAAPSESQTIFYRVTALIDGEVWQGETAVSNTVSTHILENGEDFIAHDDGTQEGAITMDPDTQLAVSYMLMHRSEFLLTKVAIFVTDLSTDDLIVEFSDEGPLPDNEVTGMTATYPASQINLGWNFLTLPENARPSFTGDLFFIRILGTPDPWGIGLDSDTIGDTFRKTAGVWNPLLTGNSMVRAIVKQLDAIIGLSEVTHDFGLVYTDDHSAPYDITVSNSGNKTLEIQSINAPPGFEVRMSGDTDWVSTLNNVDIAAGLSSDLQIRFVPTDDMTYSGNVEIASNDDVTPSVNIAVNGYSHQSEPNAFTPNGDGKNDIFKFKVISDNVQSVKMTIYNLKGRKIYDVSGQSSQPLTWDGNNDDGDECKSGPYLYVVERAGKRYKRGKIYLVK